MSDKQEIRLPPLPMPVLKQLQETEAWTRDALLHCCFPGTNELDSRKAREVMQSAIVSALDIRLDYYETLPQYGWDWSEVIGGHAAASILACFPSTRYEKRCADGSAEYEGDAQFLGELVLTGWDHMVSRRISKEETSVPSPTKAKSPKVTQAEIERRAALLAEYKAATGDPSNMRIYQATKSGIHKPQFSEWVNGILPVESATAKNFERFLAEKKRPVPRPKKPKK